METDGGGWASIIKRIDGTVDFARTYAEYTEQGVGSPSSNTEYALSLNALHELTKQGSTELLVELRFGREKKYAQYGRFEVGDSLSGFKLTLSGYDQNSSAGDAMSHSSGYRFCTFDRDADYDLQVNCA